MFKAARFVLLTWVICGSALPLIFGEMEMEAEGDLPIEMNWELPIKFIEMVGVSKEDLPVELQEWMRETVYRLQHLQTLELEDEKLIETSDDFRAALVAARDAFEDFADNEGFLEATDELIEKLTSRDMAPVLKAMTEEHMAELKNIVETNSDAWRNIGESAAKEMKLKRKEHLQAISQLKKADMSHINVVEKGIGKKAVEIMEWFYRGDPEHHSEL